MAYVYLCRVPEIDNTYRNVMNFVSKSALNTFMQNRTVINVGEVNVKYDGTIPVIDISRSYNELLNIDYVWIHSSNPVVDTYYFVQQKEIRATGVTRLSLDLDVFTTYQFDLDFQTCMIERQHEHRWLSNGNPNMSRLLVAEGLPEHEYQTDFLDYTPGTEVFTEGNLIRTDLGTVVYTTSSPLDITSDGTGGGSDGPSGPSSGNGNPEQGIPTPNGFVLIKGYEGLAQYAYDIGDGHQTIGYGCTQSNWPTYFNQLVNNQPVSEQLASEVFASLVITEFGLPLASQLQSDGILENITSNMFDALLSFTYNAGLGSLIVSDMYKSIKDGDYETAYTQWLTTNINAGTQFEEGLRARRLAEANIFLKGTYELRTIVIYGEGGSVVGTVTANNGRGYIPDIIGDSYSTGDLRLFADARGNNWYLPLEKGWTSALFGHYPNSSEAHYGIDFTWEKTGAIRGAAIYAPKDNMEVINVVSGFDGDTPDKSGGFGNYVTLYDSTTNSYHILGHMLETPLVSIGDTVNHNTKLGRVGTSGYSTGYHLHWEVRYGTNNSSNAVNPILNSTLSKWYYRKP